jgi:hypothetical protein
MYHPIDRFSKAYQDSLLKDRAESENRYAKKISHTSAEHGLTGGREQETSRQENHPKPFGPWTLPRLVNNLIKSFGIE